MMLDEVTSMSESEIHDPEALTQRCAVIAADLPRVVNITLNGIRLAAILRLKQMVVDGELPPQFIDEVTPKLLAVWASDDELKYLASVGASSYATHVLLRVARRSFLTAAFIVSFFFSEFVGAEVPLASSNVIARLLAGVLAFLAQLLVLDNLGERIELIIRWRLFGRIRKKLLIALNTFANICLRSWNEVNNLMPTS
jgi:hypothetical protein